MTYFGDHLCYLNLDKNSLESVKKFVENLPKTCESVYILVDDLKVHIESLDLKCGQFHKIQLDPFDFNVFHKKYRPCFTVNRCQFNKTWTGNIFLEEYKKPYIS